MIDFLTFLPMEYRGRKKRPTKFIDFFSGKDPSWGTTRAPVGLSSLRFFKQWTTGAVCKALGHR